MNRILKMLVFSALVVSCNNKKEKTNPTKENITESVYASGIIKSGDQYQVFSPVNGLLLRQLVKEGDTVRAGQTILVVNNETGQLQIDNAELAAFNANPANNIIRLNKRGQDKNPAPLCPISFEKPWQKYLIGFGTVLHNGVINLHHSHIGLIDSRRINLFFSYSCRLPCHRYK